MNGWAGFWIMVGIAEASHVWYRIKAKEIQLKYKVKFKWWE